MAAAPGRMSCCPFDKAVSETSEMEPSELRVSFQGGRLDALCELMDDGKLTLEDVVEYAEMSMEELEELFESWKWFSGDEGSDV